MAQTLSVEEQEKITIWKLFRSEPKLEGILFGVHGARETMFEIGYFQYLWEENLDSKIPIVAGSGYSLTTEHYINKDYVIAPKAAVWANVYYFNFGMSLPWYFDMNHNNSLVYDRNRARFRR